MSVQDIRIQTSASSVQEHAQSFSGVVEKASHALLSVRIGTKRVDAICALSCIFRPALGDEVSLFKREDGSFLITAILVRHSDEKLHMMLDRDLEVSSENITFAAQKELLIQAMTAQTTAIELNQYAHTMNTITTELNQNAQNVHWVSEKVHTIFGTLTQKARVLMERIGVAQRKVEKIEHTSSHMKQERVDHNLVIQTGGMQISSKSHIKLNARQIFMN